MQKIWVNRFKKCRPEERQAYYAELKDVIETNNENVQAANRTVDRLERKLEWAEESYAEAIDDYDGRNLEESTKPELKPEPEIDIESDVFRFRLFFIIYGTGFVLFFLFEA